VTALYNVIWSFVGFSNANYSLVCGFFSSPLRLGVVLGWLPVAPETTFRSRGLSRDCSRDLPRCPDLARNN
jgi:hypothetical protein